MDWRESFDQDAMEALAVEYPDAFHVRQFSEVNNLEETDMRLKPLNLKDELPLKILDLASGVGYASQAMSFWGHDVTAVDCPSPKHEESFRKGAAILNLPKRLEIDLAEPMPEELTGFDVIVCHALCPGRIPATLLAQQIHNKLNKNGRASILANMSKETPIVMREFLAILDVDSAIETISDNWFIATKTC